MHEGKSTCWPFLCYYSHVCCRFAAGRTTWWARLPWSRSPSRNRTSAASVVSGALHVQKRCAKLTVFLAASLCQTWFLVSPKRHCGFRQVLQSSGQPQGAHAHPHRKQAAQVSRVRRLVRPEVLPRQPSAEARGCGRCVRYLTESFRCRDFPFFLHISSARVENSGLSNSILTRYFAVAGPTHGEQGGGGATDPAQQPTHVLVGDIQAKLHPGPMLQRPEASDHVLTGDIAGVSEQQAAYVMASIKPPMFTL